MPADIESGLEATDFFRPPQLVYPFGAHVAVVEVDRDTGRVAMRDYFSVDDCGVRISPMLVRGQVHGGLAQGIAQALLEEVVYAKDGQLLTGTLMDYAVPRADDLPSFTTDQTVTPTPHNPLGAKGIGEAATIGSTPGRRERGGGRAAAAGRASTSTCRCAPSACGGPSTGTGRGELGPYADTCLVPGVGGGVTGIASTGF